MARYFVTSSTLIIVRRYNVALYRNKIVIHENDGLK